MVNSYVQELDSQTLPFWLSAYCNPPGHHRWLRYIQRITACMATRERFICHKEKDRLWV